MGERKRGKKERKRREKNLRWILSVASLPPLGYHVVQPSSVLRGVVVDAPSFVSPISERYHHLNT